MEIISILETLFSKFLLKAISKVDSCHYMLMTTHHTIGLTQRKSLFSIDANMCRLRAQLAVEANTRYYYLSNNIIDYR